MNYAQDLVRGRRFLISGATGGAGYATALLLAQCGGQITLLGRDHERTLKAKLSLPNGNHSTEIDGQYHGIFHAAGAEYIGPAGGAIAEHFDRVFEPSVGIAFDLIRQSASRKSILRDGASIVMMSSVAAVRGTKGMTIYGASKAAVEGLVKSAAVELAPRRIRVNAIRAGGFQSPMHERIVASSTPKSIDEYADKHLLGFGKSDDVANMAVYLLSDLGRWLTGSIITVDGGYSV